MFTELGGVFGCSNQLLNPDEAEMMKADFLRCITASVSVFGDQVFRLPRYEVLHLRACGFRCILTKTSMFQVCLDMVQPLMRFATSQRWAKV